jgi:DNA-binding NtrC family response regulator
LPTPGSSNFVRRPAHLLSPRVLIVEDESRLRDLLLDVIPGMGFHPLAARSAEDALRLVESDPPEIAILDLQLPGIGGMELFERLRLRWPEMQIIILTGFGDLDSAQRAIRLNVVDFLTKPFHLRDVELALDRARSRMVQEIQQAHPSELTSTEPAVRTLKQAQSEFILAALERHGGNRTAAALELGISRRGLHYWLNAHENQ